MPSKKMPLGYWIKQADQLLTSGIDTIQASFQITRTGWQILNSINDRDCITKVDLINLMKPFTDQNALDEILTTFKSEFLINESRQRLALTIKGKKLHNACFEKQKIFRQHVMHNISEQEYEIAISTLQKIVDNINNMKL